MALWAKIYLIFLVISSSSTIAIYKESRLMLTFGQVLSLLCSIALFLIYYHIIPRPQEFGVVLVLFVYIIYWEFVVNLKYLIKYFKDNKIPIEKNMFKFSILVSLGLFMPFFYIISKIFGSYV